MNPSAPSDPEAARRRRRRRALAWGGALLALLLARPALHLLRTAWSDDDTRVPPPAGTLDDASRLNTTPVAEVFPVPPDLDQAERALSALLRRAAAEGRGVSIAGARHTMGGHTLVPDGIVVDMTPLRHLELREDGRLLRAGAGACWKQVIPYLDANARSVGVMQSDHSFTIGGSLGANCHGWTFPRPPISSTVESFRLMKADGSVVRCSRTQNPELFSLVLGGYGLFGIILEADLRTVPNERYRLEQRIVPVDRAVATFDERVNAKPDVRMAYARMRITREDFLGELIINILRLDPPADGVLPSLGDPDMVWLRRNLFRGSAGNEYGKELRWEAETVLQPHLSATHFSRNQLLNEGTEIFQNRSEASTDVLHEYFVPRSGLVEFVREARRLIPAHGGDLLNVTVRYVEEDTDSLLRYADAPLFAFVMLFQQPRTGEAEARMAAMTRELIEASLAAGGRYYLPYRLHATPEQFRRAYPQADRFFELKRVYDPAGRFQNRFFQTYGGR